MIKELVDTKNIVILKQETGLQNIQQLKLSENELVPLDIDIHLISHNKRLNLPKHYHFDFRYLFMVDKITEIKIDVEEHSNYIAKIKKWPINLENFLIF